jgi:hypothetical protein
MTVGKPASSGRTGPSCSNSNDGTTAAALKRVVEFLVELEKYPVTKSREGCYSEEDGNGIVSVRDRDGGLRVVMPEAVYSALLEYEPLPFEREMLGRVLGRA